MSVAQGSKVPEGNRAGRPKQPEGTNCTDINQKNQGPQEAAKYEWRTKNRRRMRQASTGKEKKLRIKGQELAKEAKAFETNAWYCC